MTLVFAWNSKKYKVSLNPNNLILRIQSVSLSFYSRLFHWFSSSLDNWNRGHVVLAEQTLHHCFVNSTTHDVKRLQTVLESALRHRLHDVFERGRGRLEVRFSIWISTSIVETYKLGVVFFSCDKVKRSRAANVAVTYHEALGGARSFDYLFQV